MSIKTKGIGGYQILEITAIDDTCDGLDIFINTNASDDEKLQLLNIIKNCNKPLLLKLKTNLAHIGGYYDKGDGFITDLVGYSKIEDVTDDMIGSRCRGFYIGTGVDSNSDNATQPHDYYLVYEDDEEKFSVFQKYQFDYSREP